LRGEHPGFKLGPLSIDEGPIIRVRNGEDMRQRLHIFRVKMEAEAGGMQRQASNTRSYSELEETRKEPPLDPSEGTPPC
jgi:hypothetical protein